MTPDAKLVLQLLRHLNDWVPDPNPSLRRPVTGEMPTERADCNRCGGRGWFGRPGKLKRACAYCEGRGYRLVDPYTRAEALKRPAKSLGCMDDLRLDSELRKLAGLQAIREGLEAVDRATTVHERAERQAHTGSYAELHALISLLRYQAPTWYKLTIWVANHTPVVWTDEMRAIVEDVCDDLARRMSKPIRVPLWARDPEPQEPGKGRHANGYAQGERNKRIRAMSAEGFSCSRIGREFGLSKMQVSRILAASAKRKAA